MGNSSSNAKKMPNIKIVKGKKEYTSTQKPPQYTEFIDIESEISETTIITFDRDDNDEKEKKEFKTRVDKAMKKDTCYVDTIVMATIMENIISPYDPYILMWANKVSNRFDRSGDVLSINNLIGIEFIKQYIKYLVTGIEDSSKLKIINVQSSDNNFVKEIAPQHYNIVKLWITIITMHILYMDMWKETGSLRKIFGDRCKPFPLRFVAIEEPKYGFSSCIDYYKYMEGPGYKKKSDSVIIKCRSDGLPDFDSVSKVIKKYSNVGGLNFYIWSGDIREHVETRQIILRYRAE